MTSLEFEKPLAGSSEEAPSASEVAIGVARTILGIAVAEFHRIRHQPMAIATRTAQPLLWVLVFGAALSDVRGLHGTELDYQSFVVPGVIGQSILMVALFSGLAIIWERDLGMTQRYLVAPGPRVAVILGKALGAGVRVLFHIVAVLIVVRVAGLDVQVTPLTILGVALMAITGAMMFSTLSMVIASAVRSREQFQGLGQLIVLPMFFASNALYTVDLMPGWLQVIARINPLSYLVRSLRHLMLDVGANTVLQDALTLLAGALALSLVAAITYPKRAI